MDAVSKRQLVLAAFLCLESWKLYEWLFDLPPSYWVLDAMLAFFFKWSFLELIFLGLVHCWKVPRLHWPLMTRTWIFALIIATNVVLLAVGPFLGVRDAASMAMPGLDPVTIMKSGLVDDIVGSKDLFVKGIFLMVFLIKCTSNRVI